VEQTRDAISFRFASRPRWVVLHVLVALAVCLFAVAGFWQLRRLNERREHNALVEERQELPVVRELTGVNLSFRRAVLSGRYDPGEEVVLTGRPDADGRSGNHLLTPLTSDDDESIVVDRGWVPADTPRGALAPPDGQVVVEGILVPSEGSAPFVTGTSGDGETRRTTRIDLERFGDQVSYKLAPYYLLLQEQRPPQPNDVPFFGKLKPATEGSHLSYAVQWFLFIPTLLVVYGALLRRESRKRTARETTASG
jgi:surfeit locus 1 family protein